MPTPPATTAAIAPDQAWRAVLARDVRYDGRFVYAVRSTGVYCRPTCPSRRPARPRVVFFTAPAEAEGAGFRPCRRCRPQRLGGDGRASALDRARTFIDAHVDEPQSLARLAAQAGLSPAHFQRAFKAAFGLSPKQYQLAARAERLKAELRRGRSVTEALYEAGFSSGSRLYEHATRTLGMTPARYARGGHGLQIRFTLADSALGRLLVAATDRGVCAVRLGTGDAALIAELRREYPRADVAPDDSGALDRWVAEVLAAAADPRSPASVPLDLGGTSFQRRVWRALTQIPPGETRTYGELAEAVGAPEAVRAVAQACARNPVAIVVPCHRVIRKGGGLGGYRWGTARKRRLLDRERGR